MKSYGQNQLSATNAVPTDSERAFIKTMINAITGEKNLKLYAPDIHRILRALDQETTKELHAKLQFNKYEENHTEQSDIVFLKLIMDIAENKTQLHIDESTIGRLIDSLNDDTLDDMYEAIDKYIHHSHSVEEKWELHKRAQIQQLFHTFFSTHKQDNKYFDVDQSQISHMLQHITRPSQELLKSTTEEIFKTRSRQSKRPDNINFNDNKEERTLRNNQFQQFFDHTIRITQVNHMHLQKQTILSILACLTTPALDRLHTTLKYTPPYAHI